MVMGQFLLKDLNTDRFLEMLEEVQQGKAAMTRQTTVRLMKGLTEASSHKDRPAKDLTEREIELLQLVANGMANKAIAQKLSISENTVKYHMKNIMQKLHVQNRTDAVTYAIRTGLLEPPS